MGWGRGAPAGSVVWVVLPVGAEEVPAIEALRVVAEPHWRLLLVPMAPWSVATVRAAKGDRRITRVAEGTADLGTILAQARASDLVVVLDQGCSLAANAPAVFAQNGDADLVYGDEDRIGPAGERLDPFHKPAWSIDLALEQALVGTVCAVRMDRLRPALALKNPTPHEIALRLAGPDVVIRHVPDILAHRAGARRAAPAADAVCDALSRLGTAATTPELVPSSILPGRCRVRWRVAAPVPRVSVIVPVRDNPALLARCTEGVLERTDYPDIELLIADNDSVDPETLALLNDLARDPRVRVLRMPGPFNYSAINNAAVAASTGSVLVLLNSDVVVIGAEWLSEMVGHAMRPDVGAVGAKLLFENGVIQHAGVVLGVGSFEGGPGVAGHFGLGARGDAAGYAEQFVLTREVAAVTAACLALRREVFEAVGGLDAVNLTVALNDLDLCLRIRALGLRVVWTPYALLHHLESASRGPDDTPATAERFRRECRFMRDRWGAVLDDDGFYNRHFSRYDHSFLLSPPG